MSGGWIDTRPRSSPGWSALRPTRLDDLVDAGRSLAAAFAPGAAADRVAAADVAVDAIGRWTRDAAARGEPGLAEALITALGAGPDDDALANIAGLFFQTFDATAGLIGNAVVEIAGRRDAASGSASSRPAPVDAVALVDHVVRHRPAVHNTRRFFHADSTIGSFPVRSGDTALLVLAAANLDTAGPLFSFGAGAHRCPAAELAPTIARHAITRLIGGIGLDRLPTATGCRPLANTRIPVFAGEH